VFLCACLCVWTFCWCVCVLCMFVCVHLKHVAGSIGLQGVAGCCRLLQVVAGCYGVLHGIAMCCRMLVTQHTHT